MCDQCIDGYSPDPIALDCSSKYKYMYCLVRSGQCLVSVWSVSGQCLVSVWSVSGQLWSVPGQCLVSSGQCLVSVWSVSGQCLVSDSLIKSFPIVAP